MVSKAALATLATKHSIWQELILITEKKKNITFLVKRFDPSIINGRARGFSIKHTEK